MVNYAQWEGERQYQEALHRSDVREHLSESAATAERWDPTLARVRSRPPSRGPVAPGMTGAGGVGLGERAVQAERFTPSRRATTAASPRDRTSSLARIADT